MQEKILRKLRELREDDLTAMEFAAGRSVEMMQGYCNITEIPEELVGVGVMLAGMVLDGGISSGGVKSIKEGDVSVIFQEGVSKEATEEMMRCFKPELDRYRRMDW